MGYVYRLIILFANSRVICTVGSIYASLRDGGFWKVECRGSAILICLEFAQNIVKLEGCYRLFENIKHLEVFGNSEKLCQFFTSASGIPANF